MSSTGAVLLHARCIAAKGVAGRDYGFHLEHLLREFNLGPLATAPRNQPPLWTLAVLAALAAVSLLAR